MSSTTADKLNYLKGTKEAIKNAIVSKGVEVEEDATFRSYAEKIESIEVGDMTKAVYDPTGRNTDIFAYAEGLLGRGMVKSVQSGYLKYSGDESFTKITFSPVDLRKSIAINNGAGSGSNYRNSPTWITEFTSDSLTIKGISTYWETFWQVIEFY